MPTIEVTPLELSMLKLAILSNVELLQNRTAKCEALPEPMRGIAAVFRDSLTNYRAAWIGSARPCR